MEKLYLFFSQFQTAHLINRAPSRGTAGENVGHSDLIDRKTATSNFAASAYDLLNCRTDGNYRIVQSTV